MGRKCRSISAATAFWPRKPEHCRRRPSYFIARRPLLRRIFEMKKLLVAIAAAALAYEVAAAADSTDKIVRSIEPDDRTGSSLAVLVDDVPLIHTAQVVAAGQGDSRKQAEE